LRWWRVLTVLALVCAGVSARAGTVDVTALEIVARSGRQSLLWDKWFLVDRPARLAWARGFLLAGGSASVLAPMVRDLWTENGTDRPASEAAQREAVVMFFYGYLRLRIDGQYCRDASSPGDLLYDFVMEVHAVAQFAAKLPPDIMRALADEAAALELRSAAVRGADRFVCSRGRLQLRTDFYLARDLAQDLAAFTREAAYREILAFGSARPKR
jgi:hypothetical protein